MLGRLTKHPGGRFKKKLETQLGKGRTQAVDTMQINEIGGNEGW